MLGDPLEKRSRVAPAELGERGQQPQSHREDVCGRHGADADEVRQHVGFDVPDPLQQFGVTGLLAAVMLGEGADERVGSNLAVQGMEAEDAALRAYYERGMERERLSDGRGDLEFTRTTEIVLRRLPAAPAVVADIGGGPGRYALWLASLGYQVEHRDLIPLHVEQLAAEAAGVAGIRTAVGDVRDLDLPGAAVDAVVQPAAGDPDRVRDRPDGRAGRRAAPRAAAAGRG